MLEGPTPVAGVKGALDNFGIALQWAKKKGWVEIKDGNLVPLKKPSVISEEDALGKVATGEEVSEDALAILLKRKLIEKVRDDIVKRAEKLAGQEITHLSEELIKTDVWEKVSFKPYNVEVAGKRIYPGKRQPYQQFVTKMKRKLIELGFMEMSGPFVELEFWNFDALYQPQNHPARTWTDTYHLKNPTHGKLPDDKVVEQVGRTHEDGGSTGSTGWKYKWDPKIAARLMPRAHGTCLSARTLASNPQIPGKYFAIARCFRPDVLDATHLIEFNQAEGIIIDESLNLKNLLGILKMFAIEIAGAEEVKFLPDYYPFTEPSVQLSAKHPDLGWIEFGGSGIFREELTKPLGIEEPVIAWGIGIDRLAMFNLDIKDIRYLFATDLKWLRDTPMVI